MGHDQLKIIQLTASLVKRIAQGRGRGGRGGRRGDRGGTIPPVPSVTRLNVSAKDYQPSLAPVQGTDSQVGACNKMICIPG